MNHTVGSGSNRFLVVSAAIKGDTERVTAITYAGQALTFVGTSVDPTKKARVEVWRLIAPSTGTNSVSVIFNGSSSVVVAAISFANVDQTTPIAASQFATGNATLTASATLASATDQIFLAAIAADEAAKTVTAGSGQTSRWNMLNATNVIGAGSIRTGSASSTTMSYALGDNKGWVMGLFAIQPAKGVAQLAATINSEAFDPQPANPFATPGNDMLLTTTVSNVGTGSTDADSIFAVIAIDRNHVFLNAATPAFGGVVGFSTSAPALTFTPGTDLKFSNGPTPPASLAQCTYTPGPGYDSQVRYVCLNPKGTLPSGLPNGKLYVQMRARIN